MKKIKHDTYWFSTLQTNFLCSLYFSWYEVSGWGNVQRVIVRGAINGIIIYQLSEREIIV